jgi:hypothetical protein
VKSVHRARRTTALSWGAVGEVELLGVLFVWHIGQRSESAWSVSLLLAAALVTAVGMVVVVTASRLGVGVKWTVAVLVAGVGGSVAVFAIVGLVAGSDIEAGIAPLLLPAAIGMVVIAVQIPRAAPTGTQVQR